MAEPKPAHTPETPPAGAPDTRTGETPPKLKAVSEPGPGGPARSAAKPSDKGVSRGLFGLVAVLLVLAVAGLWAQTQRAGAQAEQIVSLQSQVGTLESQLDTANRQLSAYDMQMSLVQELATDVYTKMGSLLGIVEGNPFEPADPEEILPEP